MQLDEHHAHLDFVLDYFVLLRMLVVALVADHLLAVVAGVLVRHVQELLVSGQVVPEEQAHGQEQEQNQAVVLAQVRLVVRLQELDCRHHHRRYH